MIAVTAQAVACWLLFAPRKQHDTVCSALHASCRYSDHGALSLSQSKDFLIAESTCVFCVAVAVKKPLRRHRSFLILRDTVPKMNRGGAALHSGASRADIMAPIAQSGGDGASGGTGRKLDFHFVGQYGAHVPMCAILTGSSARELAKSEVGTPLSRDCRGSQSVYSGSSDQEGRRTGCLLGEHFFYPNIFIPSTAQKLFRF